MKMPSALLLAQQHVRLHSIEILKDLGKNNLWKRMLKNVIATTILGRHGLKAGLRMTWSNPILVVSIALIPGSSNTIGKASYLGAMISIFGHPGRRFGQMAEALILVLGGTLLGVAWSIFGIYLGSFVIHSNPAAAYAIRGLFLAVATMFHGFIRSRAPRLFQFVLLLVLVCVITLTSVSTIVTRVGITQILYPIFLATAVLLLVNTIIFPEFSSSFLGETTIETLNEIIKGLEEAGRYFTEDDDAPSIVTSVENEASKEGQSAQAPQENPSVVRNASTLIRGIKVPRCPKGLFQTSARDDILNDSEIPKKVSLSELIAAKGMLRKKSANCKAAQRECNFEIAFSVLPPRKLKSISSTAMKKLVANTVAIIGACESKYALMGVSDRVFLVGMEDNLKRSPNKQNTRDHESISDQASSKLNSPYSTICKLSDTKNEQLHKTDLRSKEIKELDLIKPKREIEFGDHELLQSLLKEVAKPYRELHKHVASTVDIISAYVAYTYVRFLK